MATSDNLNRTQFKIPHVPRDQMVKLENDRYDTKYGRGYINSRQVVANVANRSRDV